MLSADNNFSNDEDRIAHESAVEEFNGGAAVPSVDAAILAQFWDAFSRVAPDRRRTTAVDIGHLGPIGPEQQVALMIRATLLVKVEERGLLNRYVADPSLKSKLITVAASLPLNKNDVAEVWTASALPEIPPDMAQKIRAEMMASGLDPDFPNTIRRLINRLDDLL